MKKIIYTALFFSLLCNNFVVAQTLTFKKHWIELTDKQNTPYSVSEPKKFLSEQAIARKKLYNIPITTADLPVNPAYIAQLHKKGAKILYASKWFNAVAVELTDTQQLVSISKLPFVKTTKQVSKLARKKNSELENNHRNDEAIEDMFDKVIQSKVSRFSNQAVPDSLYYGYAFNQIKMLNGDILHAYGYTGKNVNVAIFDGGFSNVNQLDAFKHLYNNNQLKGTYDLVQGDKNVYESSAHGTQVLSCMAAYLPQTFVGTAPDANYWLFKTEDVSQETIIEECNWVAAAEIADSIGIDVINSSLGYSTFDYPQMNYDYTKMDGNTAIVTRAADFAAQRGILVVTSAGNLGDDFWQYISAPADADSVFTVGAVNPQGQYASFSSKGYTFDHRIKPNIVAQGKSTWVIDPQGQIRTSNGTSFSSPVAAGMMASLWQANKNYTNMQLMDIVQQTASQATKPDSLLGYGIPNFFEALKKANPQEPLFNIDTQSSAFVYPNPYTQNAYIYYFSRKTQTIDIQIFNIQGKLVQTQQQSVLANIPYKFEIGNNNDAFAQATKGTYFVKISAEGMQTQKTIEVVKQ